MDKALALRRPLFRPPTWVELLELFCAVVYYPWDRWAK